MMTLGTALSDTTSPSNYPPHAAAFGGARLGWRSVARSVCGLVRITTAI
jgi:hypothetical protein